MSWTGSRLSWRKRSIADKLKTLDNVTDAVYRADKNFIEVFTDRNNAVTDEKIVAATGGKVQRID